MQVPASQRSSSWQLCLASAWKGVACVGSFWCWLLHNRNQMKMGCPIHATFRDQTPCCALVSSKQDIDAYCKCRGTESLHLSDLHYINYKHSLMSRGSLRNVVIAYNSNSLIPNLYLATTVGPVPEMQLCSVDSIAVHTLHGNPKQ